MIPSTVAARIYVALSAVVVLFQLALVAGAPWGELTMGGAYRGALPPPARAMAGFSALLLLGFAAIVAIRAGLLRSRWYRASRRWIWGVFVYLVIGVVLNAATPSVRERMLWLPVTIVLATCTWVVARDPR